METPVLLVLGKLVAHQVKKNEFQLEWAAQQKVYDRIPASRAVLIARLMESIGYSIKTIEVYEI